MSVHRVLPVFEIGPLSFRFFTFKYDPFGRRIYKSSSSGTSVFAYDGDNLIEETNSSGAAVARYSQTQNIDEPLAMLRSVSYPIPVPQAPIFSALPGTRR
jgi:hypothetical protein